MKVKFLTGTKQDNDEYTGAEGILSIDLESKNIRFHDGITEGGFPVFSLNFENYKKLLDVIDNVIINENNSVINSEESEHLNTENSTIIASKKIINEDDFSVAMGYAESGNASTQNRTIHLYSETGNIEIGGQLTTQSNFSDFAEYLINKEGKEIEPGLLVTQEEDGVRLCQAGEPILGVVSHTAAIIAGDSPFCWQGRYLKDEWGRFIYETKDVINEKGKKERIHVKVENPDYNPDRPYLKRSERPDQYTPVGLLGQVFVRVSEGVKSGDRVCSGANGLGIKITNNKRTGIKCLYITQPYNKEKGYAIAKCLINIIL